MHITKYIRAGLQMKGYPLIAMCFVAVIALLILLNSSFQRTLQMDMAEQFNKQQLLIANAESSNVQTYVESISDELLRVAQFVGLMPNQREVEFNQLANGVLRHLHGIKARFTVFDRQGKAVFSKGTATSSLSGRNPQTRHMGQTCSENILIVNDMKIIDFIAPVCRAGVPSGSVMISLDIYDIAKTFLGPIKSGSHGYAWMMDEKGNLLYHPNQPEMLGKNLYKTDSSCFHCHKSFDVEKKIIEGKADHFGRHVAPTGEDKVLAFSTIKMGDSLWIVVVSSPYSEIIMPIRRSMKLYSVVLIALFLAAGTASVMLMFFYRKKIKAEELEKRKMELQQYADSLEQKVSERTAELFAEKEKLNTIVSTVGSGIVLMDMQGNIQWSNQTMRDMAKKDLAAMPYKDIAGHSSVLSSATVDDVQAEIVADLFDSKEKVYQVTTAPVKSSEGEVHGYIKLVQDVTEMKRMEEQIMHSEKLACLGRLTSGIAFEIGNPLTSVFSFIQILKAMEEDEFKKETIETISFLITRISDILMQLSIFSHMPAPELRPVKINSLVEQSVSLIQYDQRAQGITIVKHLRSDIPEIITDGNKLYQVFVNLVLNAADAMPSGGTLTIRSSLRGETVVISFDDTGVGISADDVKNIFEPLFSTKEKGTGLGLAVCYNIIKKLNGTITVSSEPGIGSTFEITLPINKTG